MKYLIEVLFKFEGTIGALLGMVVTLVTTYALKSMGKIESYVMMYDGKFRTYEKAGCINIEKPPSDLFDYGFNLIIHIYNGKDVYKSFRNFTVQFIENDRVIKELTPYNDNLKMCSKMYIENDFVNIKPKSVEEVSISGNVNRDDVQDIINVNKVVLQYCDEKNRKMELIIVDSKISQK